MYIQADEDEVSCECLLTMLADPDNVPQSTLDFACPEVIHYLTDMTEDIFDKISFTAQDCWSAGCLLVWLVTGQDPFAWSVAESDLHKLSQVECMSRKHAAWVSFSAFLMQMSQKPSTMCDWSLQQLLSTPICVMTLHISSGVHASHSIVAVRARYSAAVGFHSMCTSATLYVV